MNFLNGTFSGRRGFTLIELVVVIAIIGILAAIAVPAVSGLTGGAKESRETGDLKEVSEANQRYKSDTGSDAIFGSPTKAVEDTDNDGTIVVVIDTSDINPTDFPSTGVDVTCGDGLGTVDESVLECFGAMDFSVLVPTYMGKAPSNAGHVVPITFSDTNGADLSITDVNIAGDELELFTDADVVGLAVWSFSQEVLLLADKTTETAEPTPTPIPPTPTPTPVVNRGADLSGVQLAVDNYTIANLTFPILGPDPGAVVGDQNLDAVITVVVDTEAANPVDFPGAPDVICGDGLPGTTVAVALANCFVGIDFNALVAGGFLQAAPLHAAEDVAVLAVDDGSPDLLVPNVHTFASEILALFTDANIPTGLPAWSLNSGAVFLLISSANY